MTQLFDIAGQRPLSETGLPTAIIAHRIIAIQGIVEVLDISNPSWGGPQKRVKSG